MAKHTVSFTVPKRALGRADVQFSIKQDKSVLGTLTVSNGSIVWFPKGRTNGLKIRWSKFDRMMRNEITRIEKR